METIHLDPPPTSSAPGEDEPDFEEIGEQHANTSTLSQGLGIEYKAAWDKAYSSFLKALPGNGSDTVFAFFLRLATTESSGGNRRAYYGISYVPKTNNAPGQNGSVEKWIVKRHFGAVAFLDNLMMSFETLRNAKRMNFYGFVGNKMSDAPVLESSINLVGPGVLPAVRSAANGSHPQLSGDDGSRSFFTMSPDLVEEEAQRRAVTMLQAIRAEDDLNRFKRGYRKMKERSEELAERIEELEQELKEAKKPERMMEQVKEFAPLLGMAAAALGTGKVKEMGQQLMGMGQLAAAPEPEPEEGTPAHIRFLLRQHMDEIDESALQNYAKLIGTLYAQPSILSSVANYAQQVAVEAQKTANATAQ
jgi:hypothetical protein